MSKVDIHAILEILNSVREYLDGRADCDVSGDPLTEHPNEEMQLLGALDTAIERLEREAK